MRCIFQVKRCILQQVRRIIPIWQPPDISGGRHLENEMYISSTKMYISTGEMYYSYVAEMYISSEKMYILTGEMYISSTSHQLKYTSFHLKYTSHSVSGGYIWRPPL